MVERSGGMLPQENFENYNPWNALSSILGTVFYRIPKVDVRGRHDFLVDYFQSKMNGKGTFETQI